MNECKAKYETRVAEIGPLVSEFLDNRIVVFFRVGAPPELAEFSVLTEPSELVEDVRPGDWVVIGEHCYHVTAVGEVASMNLRNLGHLVVKCNSRTEPELPGDVCVQAKDLPPIGVGTIIRIMGNGSGPSPMGKRVSQAGISARQTNDLTESADTPPAAR
jgi:PTS system glucitol/sorbitol-specific IIA component